MRRAMQIWLTTMRLTAIALSVFILAGPAIAATYTWTGATSELWSVGGNWTSGTGKPAAGDTVVFDSNSTSNLDTILDTSTSATPAGVTIQVLDPSGPVSISGTPSGTYYNLYINAGGIDMSNATQDLTIHAVTGLGVPSSPNWAVVGAGRTLTIDGGFYATNGREVTKSGAGRLVLGSRDPITDKTRACYLSLTVADGLVELNANGTTSTQFYNAVTNLRAIDPGATVKLTGTGDYQVSSTGQIVLTGGTFDFNGKNQGGLAGSVLTVNGLGSTIANTALTESTFGYVTTTLTTDVLFSTTGDLTWNSVIGGTGGISKSGAAALNLTGNNTYSGNTTVQEGTLRLSDATSTNGIANSPVIDVRSGAYLDVTAQSGGAITLAGNQILKGAGTVVGGVNVASGSTLAPGGSIGTLSTGDLTLAGTLASELGRDADALISDLVNVTGSVVLEDGANLQLALGSGLSSPLVGDIFYLVSNDSDDAVSGAFTKLNSVDTVLSEGSIFEWNSQQWQITYQADYGVGFTGGNDIAVAVMTVAEVPEPSSLILLAAGLVGSLACACRKRK